MENANQLCFFALVDSSSSSSSPSVNQRREWCLLVCLKEQASTKIHFRAKIFRGKTSYSEAEKQNKQNTTPQHQALSYRGFTATKPYMQDSYARWLLRQRNRTRKMPCRDLGWNQGPSDLQFDALPAELSWPCAQLQMLLTTLVHNYIILFWGARGQGELGSGCCGPRGLEF